MYGDANSALKRILELVEICPKEFQAKCFEILLAGYVQSQATRPTDRSEARSDSRTPVQKTETTAVGESEVPTSALPRFKNAAKRIGISAEKLESLFDFGVDPFALHAVTLPGGNSAEKARHVALLAASRSYLATGSWAADWQEVKSLCIDHNCYDRANHAVNLRKGLGTLFKSADAGKPVELSTKGIKEAEKLLKKLVEEPAE